MPVFLVLGILLTVITATVILMHILLYGGRWGRLGLFIAAWVAVIIFWIMGI